MASVNENVRYEPDENPPPLIALGAGLQAALVILAPVALTVVIVVRIADAPEGFLVWGVFAALLVSGTTTVLQAARLGRIGSGHVLIMGTSGAFIAVCVAALVTAGPATMASLVVVSSLFQFAMAARLSLLRRIFTPVVSGTVIMLIAATVTPVVLNSAVDVPEDVDPSAAVIPALATLVTVLALVLRAPPAWRLWSPIIGIAMGCVVATPLGLYDIQGVLDAGWIGVPLDGWPGFDLNPGAEFWGLLPAFIIVTLVGAIETIGDGVAIQRVSRRRPQATDFRVVQGALNADGMGNLLSGLAGTLPNTTYSTSISLADVTGIGSRRVGIIIGASIVAIAFLPKVAALLIAIPSSVAAAYILVLLGLLFVQGMRIVVQEGVDHRTATVAGISFWLGVGFQNQWIFADQLGDGFVSILLGNGMTSGALAAVIMMLFVELTSARRKRLKVALSTESLPQLDAFLRASATKARWDNASTERLVLVGEETMASLLVEDDERPEGAGARRLVVTARTDHARSELEFVTGSEGENMEDRLAYMGETPDIADEREISFRLLRHYASSVRHQKYHGEDIVTVSVAGSRPSP